MAQAKKPAGRKPVSEAEKLARKNALAGESKSDKFRRLAKKRIPRAIKALQGVANLAGYEYTPEQREKVLAILDGQFRAVIERFNQDKKSKASETFDI